MSCEAVRARQFSNIVLGDCRALAVFCVCGKFLPRTQKRLSVVKTLREIILQADFLNCRRTGGDMSSIRRQHKHRGRNPERASQYGIPEDMLSS